jgi:hypothetical protein
MSYQQTLERTYREAHHRLYGKPKIQFFQIIKPVEIPLQNPPLPPEPIIEIEFSPLSTKRNLPSLRFLMRWIAETEELPVAAIKGPRHSRNIVMVRQIFYYLARHQAQATLGEIGRYCGRRDHTTVLSGIRKIERLRLIDADLCLSIAFYERHLARGNAGITQFACPYCGR